MYKTIFEKVQIFIFAAVEYHQSVPAEVLEAGGKIDQRVRTKNLL